MLIRKEVGMVEEMKFESEMEPTDTPETDMMIRDIIISAKPGDSLPLAIAMIQQARKLERERDALERDALAKRLQEWTDQSDGAKHSIFLEWLDSPEFKDAQVRASRESPR